MSRTVRMFAALALAGVPLLGVGPASAASSSEPASNGAYFYSAGIDKPEQSPAVPPNVTGDNTDMVAPGHLAVAVRAPGEIDKKSFLFFDLLTVPFDATITKAVVTVPLAPDGDGNRSMSPDPAKVRTCPADATGFAAQDGANTSGAPKELCEEFSGPAMLSADEKAYTFDITTMASAWLTMANNGMALTVAEGAKSSPFQVVFKPFSEATIALEYTEPPAEVVTETITPEQPLSDSSGSGSPASDSFSGESAPLDLGTSFDSGSSDTGSFGSTEAPLIGGELLPETAEQEVAEPTVAEEPVATRPVASGFQEALSPTPAFLLAGLLLAGVLALLSMIMGDARVPASLGRQSRLSQALQARQRGPGRSVGS